MPSTLGLFQPRPSGIAEGKARRILAYLQFLTAVSTCKVTVAGESRLKSSVMPISVMRVNGVLHCHLRRLTVIIAAATGPLVTLQAASPALASRITVLLIRLASSALSCHVCHTAVARALIGAM